MKKVLFTASTYSHINHFHRPYLAALRQEGWTVHVACGGAVQPIVEADQVIHVPFQKKMTAPNNWVATRQLRTLIKKEGYDWIATHTSLAAFFTRLACKGLKNRPRIVNMAHGYLFDDQSSWTKQAILRTAEQMTARETDSLLTMNQWDFDMATRYHLGKTIANIPGIGVDFPHENPDKNTLRKDYNIPEDAFVLLYPAEFSKRKNQKFLINALKNLPKSVFLVLPGNGIFLEEWKTLAQGLPVLFPGYLTDVSPWYQMADCVVSASRSEGLPFHIMEAMYHQKPVVATAVKGHTDLVIPGETGFLFPFDDEATFCHHIQALAESPELVSQFGKTAKAQVMQYGLDVVLPQVMAHYETMCPLEV